MNACGKSKHLNKRAKRYAMPPNWLQNLGEAVDRAVVRHQSEAPRGVAVLLGMCGQCVPVMQAD
jgi:hypothetical protein